MALNFLQRRIQRSIFEAIRKVLVDEGYIPDIANYANTESGFNQFNQDLETIANGVKEFAVELFGHGSSQSKGLKKSPRITIHINRSTPGDIGFETTGYYKNNPNDPDKIIKVIPPFDTSNIQLDIHLVSSTADQDVTLNAILQNAIGVRKYLQLYDEPQQTFFIRQYDYYDIADTAEGITEKVFSYQVDDLILSDEKVMGVPLITEITLQTTLSDIESLITQTGVIIGPYIDGEDMVINLSGINF